MELRSHWRFERLAPGSMQADCRKPLISRLAQPLSFSNGKAEWFLAVRPCMYVGVGHGDISRQRMPAPVALHIPEWFACDNRILHA